MALSKVTRNYQVTIPTKIRKLLHIEEGSLVEFEVENGIVIMRTKVLIDGDQAWFWTKEWQEKEKEAEEALKKKQVKTFKNAKDAKKHLKGLAE